MKKILIIYLLTSIVSCSAMDAVTTLVKPNTGLTVNTDLQSGDRNFGQNENTVIEDNEGTIVTNATDHQFTDTGRVTINEISPSVLLLLILGWLLPAPHTIYQEIKSWFKKKN